MSSTPAPQATPPGLPPSLTLVTIHSLTSEQGVGLNGRMAAVISFNRSTARLELVVLPASTTDTAQRRAIRPANVTPQTEPPPRDSPPYAAYSELLHTIAVRRFQGLNDVVGARHAFDLLFALPGYTPPRGERAAYANVLRESGEPARAARMLARIVREAADARDANENYFRYDLGAAFLNAGMLHDALAATIGIDTVASSDEVHKQIKCELLQMLCVALKNQSDPKEADACRALLVEKPNNGIALWNLGAVLCRTGSTAEGLQAYTHAIERGTGLSDDQRARIQRDKDIGELELKGEFGRDKVVSVGPDGEIFTIPSDIGLVPGTAEGLASQILRQNSSRPERRSNSPERGAAPSSSSTPSASRRGPKK